MKPLVVLLACFSLGCSESLALRYDCAAVSSIRERYTITRGPRQVLQVSHSSFLPIPDAFSGYSLFIEVEPSFVVEGAVLEFPSPQARAFFSEVHAPLHRRSEACTGRVTFVKVRDAFLLAEVSVEVVNPAWRYSGAVQFKSAVLTSALHP